MHRAGKPPRRAAADVGAGPGAGRDPRTTAALLKIATQFNNDYDRGIYEPVWDRWDARSHQIITRADYIRRHTECPDSPQSVTVEGASPGVPYGAWIVDYETGGVQLHDRSIETTCGLSLVRSQARNPAARWLPLAALDSG